MKTLGYATRNATSPLAPFEIERRSPGAHDVQLDVLFCGICHSDVHQARNEWHNTVYPCMPGHEIVGRVTKTGASVTRFREGDLVGVGCMVDSCQHCHSCEEDLENYCESGFTATYNGHLHKPSAENLTFGGYSAMMVVNEEFVLRIPATLDAASAAPLLCAGITTYSPLRHWNVGKGSKVGVAGFGGLGHMAVKLAVAMGAQVSVITTSPEKAGTAKGIGAHGIIVSKDPKDMASHAASLDLIISTIPVSHDANPYLPLLKRDGALVIVGCVAPLARPTEAPQLIMGRKSIAGSLIGGVKETQEMLDFCAAHNIAADIEVISADKINEAFDTLATGSADFRYVIDMSTLTPTP